MKQIIYKVLYVIINENGQSEWVEKQIKEIKLNNIGIESVITIDNDNIVIDNVSAFVREFVGMYDKNGVALFSDDIVKFPFNLPEDGKEAEMDTMGSIVFINGAYCISLPEEETIVYLTQGNVRLMEKIGNSIQHNKVLEKDVDEKIFEPKSTGENLENNTAEEAK